MVLYLAQDSNTSSTTVQSIKWKCLYTRMLEKSGYMTTFLQKTDNLIHSYRPYTNENRVSNFITDHIFVYILLLLTQEITATIRWCNHCILLDEKVLQNSIK